MSRNLLFVTLLTVSTVLLTGTAWAQITCPAGTVTIVADRDNTLYQDGTGMLTNGLGTYLFAGRTGAGGEDIRRAVLHFDVAGAVMAGSTIGPVRLLMNLDQPKNNGTHDITLHRLTADWGEGSTNDMVMGQGIGAAATTNSATWVHTFFDTASWATQGGDFSPTASASETVATGTGGTYIWNDPDLVADVQSWLDTPGTNFGWLVLGNESSAPSAARFGTRENTGNEPTLCVEVCTGTPACGVFDDNFESMDTTGWDVTVGLPE